MLDLQQARAKIERAKKHIIDFQTEKIAFLETNPYTVVAKYEPARDVTRSIMGPLPVIPDELSVIVGDAAQNLRSALDYLVATLVIDNGGDPKRVYFPISQDVEKYDSEASGKTKGLSIEARKIIDRIQPYGGGNGWILWVLHTLNNADKHRLLVGAASGIAENHQIKLSPEGNTFSVLFKAPALKEDDVLGEVSGNSENDHRIKFTFDIAFGDPEIVSGEPIIPTLQYMTQVVESIVSYFEANF